MTTVFVFAFSVAVIAPAQYNLPDAPVWVPFAVIACGAIPMLVVMRATAPFVTYVHLQVPFYARRSREHLSSFLEKVPQNTEIDLTTIGNFGWPHVYRMRMAELRKAKHMFSAANLRRVPLTSSKPSRRPWWKGDLPMKFYVGNERVRVRGSTPWQRVWQQLKTA
ncbi:MAG: hypothetical protein Q9216_002884 [Gyalolechia sp. 2 TL-2023]